jgi:hypothetical protein
MAARAVGDVHALPARRITGECRHVRQPRLPGILARDRRQIRDDRLHLAALHRERRPARLRVKQKLTRSSIDTDRPARAMTLG